MNREMGIRAGIGGGVGHLARIMAASIDADQYLEEKMKKSTSAPAERLRPQR